MGLLVEGTDYEIAGVQRGDVYNEIVIKTINTVDTGDTIVVDLTKYGIHPTGLMGVTGYVQATANSIVVQTDPTTTVSSDEITLTLGTATNDQTYIVVKGFPTPNPAASL